MKDKILIELQNRINQQTEICRKTKGAVSGTYAAGKLDGLNTALRLIEAIPEELTVGCWGIPDIMEQAEEDGIEVTEEQLKEILNLMLRKADTRSGISWDTISYFIQKYFEEEEGKPNA